MEHQHYDATDLFSSLSITPPTPTISLYQPLHLSKALDKNYKTTFTSEQNEHTLKNINFLPVTANHSDEHSHSLTDIF